MEKRVRERKKIEMTHTHTHLLHLQQQYDPNQSRRVKLQNWLVFFFLDHEKKIMSLFRLQLLG